MSNLTTLSQAVDTIWQLAEASPRSTKNRCGEMWENLCQRFLEIDSQYKNMVSRVENVAKENHGIDLIVHRKDGELPIAVQCKYSHNQNASLQQAGVKSFLSELLSGKYSEGIIMWSQTRISPKLNSQLQGLVNVKLLTAANMDGRNIDWDEIISPSGLVVAQEPKTPWKHQREAVKKTAARLRETDRTKLIMACGTGKTLTAQLLAEEVLQDKNTLFYFVPSLALMSQTHRAWVGNMQPEPNQHRQGATWEFWGICSDSDVGSLDSQELAQMEMPVLRGVDKIRERLEAPLKAPQTLEDAEGKHMRAVLCTYQSADLLLDACKKIGLSEPAAVADLMICDEAHRTTGVESKTTGVESKTKGMSPWQMPIEAIPAKKRVFATATPKIFTESTKSRGVAEGRSVWSMDNEEFYGAEGFFKLGFGEAILQDLLTDYKIHLIQTIDAAAEDTLNIFWDSPEGKKLDEEDKAFLTSEYMAQMIGLWNTITNRSKATQTSGSGEVAEPMWKNIVYHSSIKNSKAFTNVFKQVAKHLSNAYGDADIPDIDVRHIDGSMSATKKRNIIAFLEEGGEPFGRDRIPEIRIVSNCRVLSEGVDVPTLDSLCFMQPKSSTIEIIQSVGRVMRKAGDNKKYGHIILPRLLKTGETPEQHAETLSKDGYWKTSWKVLEALRSHDPSLADDLAKMGALFSEYKAGQDRGETPEMSIGQIINASMPKLNPSVIDKQKGELKNISMTDDSDSGTSNTTSGASAATSTTSDSGDDATASGNFGDSSAAASVAVQETLWDIYQTFPKELLRTLAEGIVGTINDKCGDIAYWDTWVKDAAEAYETVLARLRRLCSPSDNDTPEEQTTKTRNRRHVDKATRSLEPTMGNLASFDETLSILAQYLIFKPVFVSLFGSEAQFSDNSLSQAVSALSDRLKADRMLTETQILANFYESVERQANAATTPAMKQTLIKKMYEDFIKIVFPDTAKDFGVVYTPNEIVDFILRSTDWAIRKHFKLSDGIADKDIKVLDPFSGTGTFLVNLIQNEDLIPQHLLKHKYTNNIASGEIMPLPYWATEINLEQAYASRAGGYMPYNDGIIANTFLLGDPSAKQPPLSEDMFSDNTAKAREQNEKRTKCIVTNPPWNVGLDDKAAGKTVHELYPHLSQRIQETYAAESDAKTKGALYDSYVMAFRWASDRIGEKGVVGMVTNNSWLTGVAAAGIRRTFEKEFDAIYILDLLGKCGPAVTTQEERMYQGCNPFGVTVGSAVVVFVKTGEPRTWNSKCSVYYSALANMGKNGDSQCRSKLDTLAKLKGVMDNTLECEELHVDEKGNWLEKGNKDFEKHSPMGDPATKKSGEGDAIFCLYSRGLATAMDHLMTDTDRDILWARAKQMTEYYNQHIDDGLTTPRHKDGEDGEIIKWHSELKDKLESGKRATISDEDIRVVEFRPFVSQFVFWNQTFIQRMNRLDDIFLPVKSLNTSARARAHGNLTAKQRCINIASVAHTLFDVIATVGPPDLHLNNGASQCFPRYRLVSKSDFSHFSGNPNRFQMFNDSTTTRLGIDRESTVFPPLPTAGGKRRLNLRSDDRGYL